MKSSDASFFFCLAAMQRLDVRKMERHVPQDKWVEVKRTPKERRINYRIMRRK
jgi:hypothetical protein